MGASSDLALPSSHLNRLLTAYLNPLLRLEDAAESLNLTLLDFIAQLEHPDVERALAHIAAAKARRAEHLALNAHDSAIAALVRLVESDKATGPVRAAAASLLRRIRDSEKRDATARAVDTPPPPRGEGRGEGPEETRAPFPSNDKLPPPLGGGRGEGHPLRSRAADTPPPPRGEGRGEGLEQLSTSITHSEPSASAVALRCKAIRGASDGCQTPTERSSGAGLVSDPQDAPPRAEGAREPQATANHDRPMAGVPP